LEKTSRRLMMIQDQYIKDKGTWVQTVGDSPLRKEDFMELLMGTEHIAIAWGYIIQAVHDL
jgi:hypothetical protein